MFWNQRYIARRSARSGLSYPLGMVPFVSAFFAGKPFGLIWPNAGRVVCLHTNSKNDEFYVETSKMEEQLVKFDDDDKETYDVVLIAEEKKFYCSKVILAKHSTILKSLLFSPYQEHEKKEIELKDVSVIDFNNFLLLIHGALEIDDDNVKGLLLLSNMWRAPAPLKKCRIFLMNQSKMSMKERYDLAAQYGFEDLKKFFIDNIQSPFELSQLIPDSIAVIDPSSVAMLLEKSLQFNGITPGKEVKKTHWLYSEQSISCHWSPGRGNYLTKKDIDRLNDW